MRSESGANGALRKTLAVWSWSAAVATAALVGATTPAVAQTAIGSSQPVTPPNQDFGTTQVLSWDLPEQGDTRPGAMIADTSGDGSRLWFVTRAIVPRVYRMDFRGGKRNAAAQWQSWDLDPSGGPTAGLRRIKPSKDAVRRFVFVRTTLDIQRIDTSACAAAPATPPTNCRVKWNHELATSTDAPPDVISPNSDSDLSVDDMNFVYGAFASFDATTAADRSFIERLDTNITDPNTTTPNAVRWYVGGSAGECPSAVNSAPCLSGVAVHPRNRRFVYYSEPAGGPDGQGAIGELDTVNNTVRRWTFAALNAQLQGADAVREPRHLLFDDDETIWIVTGSHHIVSLDVKKNQMTKHMLPPSVVPDLFAVSPDSGIVGYTNTGPFWFTGDAPDATPSNIAGILMPARNFVPVPPVACDPTGADPSRPCPRRANFLIPPQPQEAIRTSGTQPAAPATIRTRRTANGDGVFNEALTDSLGHDSFSPLGVFADKSGPVGTVFYAVGDNARGIVNRIERARLRRENFRARIERDDDDIDDDGKRADVDDDVDGDGIPNAMDADNDNDGDPDITDPDDDNDGIEDDFDTKDKKETKQSSQQAVPPAQYAEDTFTLNPGTLLVVASATSTDVLAPVSVEIVDEAGQIVASSLASPGAAVVTLIPPANGGIYTLRVKNQSVGLATVSTKILTRELWPVLPLVGGV